jgi:hypothetical protein
MVISTYNKHDGFEKRNLISIPEPKGLPYIGNVLEFRSEVSLHDLDRLHKTYGK